MDEKFSFDKVPNWIIIIVMITAFTFYMLFFDKNIGYSAVKTQNSKIDTLEMQCSELREQITLDSIALESVYDSAKFEHYLREQRLFLGEGETMYEVNE